MKEINRFTHYSFFTEMSELASRHGSFDLSLGLPDFDIDDRLKNLKESADLNTYHYEPLAGNPLLIENIIASIQNVKTKSRYHP
jgi:methionine aminotransferase